MTDQQSYEALTVLAGLNGDTLVEARLEKNMATKTMEGIILDLLFKTCRSGGGERDKTMPFYLPLLCY